MPHIVKRDCIRCGVAKVQLSSIGTVQLGQTIWEVAFSCNSCSKVSIYLVRSDYNLPGNNFNFDSTNGVRCEESPILNTVNVPPVDVDIPERIADIFQQAAKARRLQMFDASGAMFRKTIDVASKHIFATDTRLIGKTPADALRVRIKALGALKILEEDIVDLADVAVVDGNDAAHEMDPYSAEEAETLEDLTLDLLDRLFVRPARVARVKAKQIAAGQRKN